MKKIMVSVFAEDDEGVEVTEFGLDPDIEAKGVIEQMQKDGGIATVILDWGLIQYARIEVEVYDDDTNTRTRAQWADFCIL